MYYKQSIFKTIRIKIHLYSVKDYLIHTKQTALAEYTVQYFIHQTLSRFYAQNKIFKLMKNIYMRLNFKNTLLNHFKFLIHQNHPILSQRIIVLSLSLYPLNLKDFREEVESKDLVKPVTYLPPKQDCSVCQFAQDLGEYIGFAHHTIRIYLFLVHAIFHVPSYADIVTSPRVVFLPQWTPVGTVQCSRIERKNTLVIFSCFRNYIIGQHDNIMLTSCI